MDSNGKLGFGGKLFSVKNEKRGRIHRLRLPGIGEIAYCKDPGNALIPGAMMFATHLDLIHRARNGRIIEVRDLGSGLVTVVGVNKLVSDAVTGGIGTLANFKYMDTGTGSTAATDGNTALQTAITATAPARVAATLTNGQTATTGNHAAILTYTGTILYNTSGPTYPIAITEWGLFDATSAGNMWDHKIFSAVNVNNGDSITFTYNLTINSNS
jgi:hypothetical protein